jgi:hypothetical protein
MYPKTLSEIPDSSETVPAPPAYDPEPTEAPFVRPTSIGAPRGLPLPSSPLEVALTYCQVLCFFTFLVLCYSSLLLIIFFIQRAIAELNFAQEKLQTETDRRHKCELQLDDQEEAAYEWRTALIVLATLVLLDALARALWHRYREGEPPLDR